MFESTKGRCILARDLVQEAKPPIWIVDGLIIAGGIHVLAGEAKTGKKTWIAMDLARCVSNGLPFLGRAVRPTPVIYSFFEDSPALVARRLAMLGLTADSSPYFNCTFGMEILPDIAIAVSKSPHLWIMDTMAEYAASHGVKNENDSMEMTRLMNTIRPLVQVDLQPYPSTIFMTHHFNKMGQMRGSSAINAAVDGWFYSTAVNEDIRRISWKLRNAPDGETGALIRVEGPRLVIQQVDIEPAPRGGSNGNSGVNPDRVAEMAKRLEGWIVQNANGASDSFKASGLAGVVGISASNPNFRAVLQSLCECDTLSKVGKGSQTAYRVGAKLAEMLKTATVVDVPN